MSKLGYTWYPQNWDSSDRVFALTLAEKAVYRELIDRAMLNDNIVEYKPSTWARKWGCSLEDLDLILKVLIDNELIILEGKIITCPECKKRIDISERNRENGKKGGRPKKTQKANIKPNGFDNIKPCTKGKEKENRIEYKENINRIESELRASVFEYFLDELKSDAIEATKFYKHFSDRQWVDNGGVNCKRFWKKKARSWVDRSKKGKQEEKHFTPPYHKPHPVLKEMQYKL